ncbi:hypothetical protein HII31_11402 [Pseudocercospora fuligena]|uniref:CFEM domain-containing protein n=1 Tax=Pseudocercospora fuligena TaxID=685502 RepID=A0A8H6R911_9PEZI|nr:hypothetical protein HII31_11402 [Pseudocercospora fuligena]
MRGLKRATQSLPNASKLATMAQLLLISTLLVSALVGANRLEKRQTPGPLCPEVDGATYTDDLGVGYIIRCGWDTSGALVGQHDVETTFYDCFSECDAISTCFAFTWAGVNGAQNGTGTAWCYFKGIDTDGHQPGFSDETGLDNAKVGVIQPWVLGYTTTYTTSTSTSTTSTSPGAVIAPTATTTTPTTTTNHCLTPKQTTTSSTASSFPTSCSYDGQIRTDSNGVQYQVECGSDTTGQDVGSYYPTSDVANSFEECYAQCDAISGCQGFTWLSSDDTSINGNGNGNCYFKAIAVDGNPIQFSPANDPTKVAAIKVIQGVVTTYSVGCGFDTTGDLVGSNYATTNSYQECYAICASYALCEGFTWSGANGAVYGSGSGNCYFKGIAVDGNPITYSGSGSDNSLLSSIKLIQNNGGSSSSSSSSVASSTSTEVISSTTTSSSIFSSLSSSLSSSSSSSASSSSSSSLSSSSSSLIGTTTSSSTQTGPSPTISACVQETITASSGTQYAISCSTNSDGGLLDTVVAPDSYLDCITPCDNNSACIGFTYSGVAGGVGAGNCYLKEAVNGATTLDLTPDGPDLVSGLRIGAPGGQSSSSSSSSSATVTSSSAIVSTPSSSAGTSSTSSSLTSATSVESITSTSSALPQISDLPDCSQSCVTPDYGGCDANNVTCICSNTNFLTQLAYCVREQCDTQGLADTIAAATSICDAAGVTSLPTAAPTTSTASSTTSTSLPQISDLPDCSQSCVTPDYGGCDASNVTCICSNTAFLMQLAYCVREQCDTQGLADTIAAATSICGAVGVTTLPTVVPTTSSTTVSTTTSLPQISDLPDCSQSCVTPDYGQYFGERRSSSCPMDLTLEQEAAMLAMLPASAPIQHSWSTWHTVSESNAILKVSQTRSRQLLLSVMLLALIHDCKDPSANASTGGCDASNVTCICSSTALLQQLAYCVREQCDTQGLADTIAFANRVCNAVGVTSLPTAVPTSSSAISSLSSAASSRSSAVSSISSAASASITASPSWNATTGMPGSTFWNPSLSAVCTRKTTVIPVYG